MRRPTRMLPVAVLLLLVTPAASASATAEWAEDLQVVEAFGVGSAMGVITRVPAASPGGAMYAEAQITVDKAIGRAAGFFPGELGEAFLGTSAEFYENPSLVTAQYPPGHFPAEDRLPFGQETGAGAFGTFHARAPSPSEVSAEATLARGPDDAPVTFGASSARSVATVDGGVVTSEVITRVFDIEVGDVLRIGEAVSRATVRTAADAPPEITFRSSTAGVTVNGVGGRLDHDGLAVAGAALLGPAELAAFNAGLEQLRQMGVTLAALPVDREEEPGRAQVSGGAFVFRYQLPDNPIPNDIGNDQEFVIAQVHASAIAVAGQPLPGLDDAGLDDLTREATPVAPGPAPAAPAVTGPRPVPDIAQGRDATALPGDDPPSTPAPVTQSESTDAYAFEELGDPVSEPDAGGVYGIMVLLGLLGAATTVGFHRFSPA